MNALILLLAVVSADVEFGPVYPVAQEFKQPPPAFRETAPETYLIPFATTGWRLNGGHATVGHLTQHGCPLVVARMYSSSPNLMDQIHSGYHEMSAGGRYKMMLVTVERPAVTTSLPVIAKKKRSPAACPSGQCPWAR